MGKITDIGSKECRMIVEESLVAIQRTLNKYGLTADRSGMARYDGHSMTVKIEVKVPGRYDIFAESGHNKYMEMYDIKAPYGFEFQSQGKTYRVTGINHRARKNRVLLVDSNGGEAACTVDYINFEVEKAQTEVKKEGE